MVLCWKTQISLTLVSVGKNHTVLFLDPIAVLRQSEVYSSGNAFAAISLDGQLVLWGKSQADTVGSNRVFEFRHRRSSGWATEVKSCTDQWEGRNFRITASQLFDLFEVPGKLAAASLFRMRCWIWRTQAPWDQSSGMTWSCFISKPCVRPVTGCTPVLADELSQSPLCFGIWAEAWQNSAHLRDEQFFYCLYRWWHRHGLCTQLCSEISYSVIHLSLPPAVSLSLFFLFPSICLSLFYLSISLLVLSVFVFGKV